MPATGLLRMPLQHFITMVGIRLLAHANAYYWSARIMLGLAYAMTYAFLTSWVFAVNTEIFQSQNNYPVMVSAAYAAAGADQIMSSCHSGGRVSGQRFNTDNWNIVVNSC